MSSLIPLSSKKYLGLVTAVDDEDYEALKNYSWNPMKTKIGFYAQTTLYSKGEKKKTITLHRFLLGISDPKIFIDHKNHNGLDNTRDNLRVTVNKNNVRNQRKTHGKVSKYKGIALKRDRNRRKPWQAQIQVEGQHHNLGHYETEEQAALAYNDAALHYFGEFALLNEVKNV